MPFLPAPVMVLRVSIPSSATYKNLACCLTRSPPQGPIASVISGKERNWPQNTYSHTKSSKLLHGSISRYLGEMFSNISEAASTQVGVTQIVAVLGSSLGLLLYIAAVIKSHSTSTKTIDRSLTAKINTQGNKATKKQA